MATIHLVFFFVAGEADLVGIDDDDVIAGVEEGGVDRFVLAHQHHSDFRGEPAEDNILRVQTYQLRWHVVLGREMGTHRQTSPLGLTNL